MTGLLGNKEENAYTDTGEQGKKHLSLFLVITMKVSLCSVEI